MSSAEPPTQRECDEANAGPDYKEQLDEAAERVKNPDKGSTNNEGGLLAQAAEKVSQYVPAAGKVLGRAQGEATPPPPPQAGLRAPGPPERPNHDAQIEEFVRDQHRSKAEDGTLAG